MPFYIFVKADQGFLNRPKGYLSMYETVSSTLFEWLMNAFKL